MKTFYKVLLIPLLFFACERLIRTQTDGFRIEKTHFEYTTNPTWNTDTSATAPEVLQQSFHFLGSGVQCYAFLSEDQTTVLKIFKHYHLWPNSSILKKIPLPQPLNHWKNIALEKRAKRIDKIFASALIAYNNLPDKTGTFFLNLNPTGTSYPNITIYDKIGVRHSLDLNKTPFLLQKKADLIFSYLENHPKETKGIIDSLFHCLRNRCYLGITNHDPIVHKNFGVIAGEVIEFDIGSFEQLPLADNSLYFHREVFYETLEVENWLRRHRPEHLEYFEHKRLEAIKT